MLDLWLREDTGDGDHSTLSCIPPDAEGTAGLLAKDSGLIAGIRITRVIFEKVDPDLRMETFMEDGHPLKQGEFVFRVTGKIHSILRAERLVLNVMQRMSGIATRTARYVERLRGLPTRVIDTRKTAPGLRVFDKEAVRIGGGFNHRMGLFDMIMLKDNHIDFAGGIDKAIRKVVQYLHETGRDLEIEIETRNLQDVNEVIRIGQVHRIMLDNFSLADTREAVRLIAGRFRIESSGGITLMNIRDYAECGVDCISVGALTHRVKGLDLSLQAIQE